MVLKRKKHDTTRNLLGYFLESKVWATYQNEVVDNYAYWIINDPLRASKMYSSKAQGKKGFTVAECLYDMIDCVYASKLKSKTKSRLYDEIDELERWHQFEGTLENDL